MAKRFGDNAMRRIADAVRWVENQPSTQQPPRRQMLPAFSYEFFLGKTDGSGIAARSGTTPGSGTVTLYYLASNPVALTAQTDGDDNDVTVTCYNLSSLAVAASAYVMIAHEHITGTYWAVWEDC